MRALSAENGYSNLIPAGNLRAVKHGLHSERTLTPRVREIAESLLASPHLSEHLDEIGILELARLEVLIEKMDEYLDHAGLTNKNGAPRAMIDLRLRASRRQLDLLAAYGLTAFARSGWVGRDSLKDEINRRVAALRDHNR